MPFQCPVMLKRFIIKEIRLLLAGGALAIGLFIVGISLISTGRVISYEGTQATQKKLYFNQAVLPDHLFYPAVALADNALLMVVPANKQVELRLAYGQIRMDYAWGLWDKGEEELAIIALTKSQKYLNQAVTLMIELEMLGEFGKEVELLLASNIEQADCLINQTDLVIKHLAQDLNQANRVLLQQLQGAELRQ